MMEIASRAVALHFSTEFLDRGDRQRAVRPLALTFLRGIRNRARNRWALLAQPGAADH
jgi:hypothetical protein